jgi:hypothetical protein
VRGIVDQWRRLRVDRNAQIGTQRRRRARPDPRRDVWVSLFESTDDGARDTDRASDGGLANACAESDLAELFAATDGGSSQLAVAFVDRRRG